MAAEAPTFENLLASINALIEQGPTATPEQAKAVKEAVDRLIDPARSSTLDFKDPANSGLTL